MKNFALAAILILFSIYSGAQARIAIAGGANQSSINQDNELPGWESRTGAHFGLIGDILLKPNSGFFFQPGVIFFNKGRKFQQTFDTTVSNILEINRKEFLNTIDIPLNLVYKFEIRKKLKLLLGAGPYVSFIYNGKLETQTISKDTIDFEDKLLYNTESTKDIPVGNSPGKYKGLDFGFNGLAGIESGKLFLTANYSRGLSNIYSPMISSSSASKHEVIGVTLGIFLGRAEKAAPEIKDADKDGITDDLDICPNEPGSELTKGCPDKDADGIADKDDSCPDKPGTLPNKGCPVVEPPPPPPVVDSDNDGINDKEDKCPSVAGLGRYEGCPVPDTDGDGINDEEDKCPAEKGTTENNGCPGQQIKQEIIEKVNFAARKIQFRFTQATLLPDSYPVLDEVVTILKQDPSLQLSIEGHTSADGNSAANLKLSQDRADNVKNYLVSKGIDAGRLTARGFGQSQPLNNGKTEAEKSLNRRVELKLSN